MFPLNEFFKSLPRLLLTVGLVAAGLVALFVAWWIAVMLVLGLAIYLAVKRILPRKAPAGAPTIIEGEFRIERDDTHGRSGARSEPRNEP